MAMTHTTCPTCPHGRGFNCATCWPPVVPETEYWEAWLDGATADERVTFEVDAGRPCDIASVAAAVLGVEVSEALNVRRL